MESEKRAVGSIASGGVKWQVEGVGAEKRTVAYPLVKREPNKVFRFPLVGILHVGSRVKTHRLCPGFQFISLALSVTSNRQVL